MSFKPVNKKYLGYTKNKYEDFQKYKKDLQYKINRFKKPNYNSSFQNEEQKEFSPKKPFLNGNPASDGIELINKKVNLPIWNEYYENINKGLKEIKEIEKEIIQLSSERIKMQFGNFQKLDRKIHDQITKATELIHYCEENLKLIDEKSNARMETTNDKKIRINIQRSLASQIQEVTNSLRHNQKRLFDNVKKYNNIEGGEFLRLSEEKMLEMKDTEIENNKNELELMEELQQDRDEEINKLVSTINELTKIFKQMNQLVIDQGTVLDRIDFNIEETLVQTKKANVELKKADDYSKSKRATYCITILIVLIVLFLIILILKYSN